MIEIILFITALVSWLWALMMYMISDNYYLKTYTKVVKYVYGDGGEEELAEFVMKFVQNIINK